MFCQMVEKHEAMFPTIAFQLAKFWALLEQILKQNEFFHALEYLLTSGNITYRLKILKN